ncbi:hypothetical protein MC378_10775 [Polaribacter sp. MSW13]|uniref:Uncharacterized protein n=1 Tax=Polaribacter marinus TaxID=2916838 RepID=A0A9X2AN80_9FLAO|nr:hypothetical protein [Polaribacter marinus]MCI2229649.1 hypothetical protein [Polaribacter marinus]
MSIDSKSLCNACMHVNSCSLTSSKKFIWSCSEYEVLSSTDTEPILPTNFSFTKSEKEIEIN